MSLIFSQLLDGDLIEWLPFEPLFASEQGVPPGFSYQVNFPCLELVFSGEYLNQIWDREEGGREISALPGQALYILPTAGTGRSGPPTPSSTASTSLDQPPIAPVS